MDLREAIENVEKRHFRTASDTGASFNALVVQNSYRNLLGMPRLTLGDLRQRERHYYMDKMARAFLVGNLDEANLYADSVRRLDEKAGD